MVLMSPQDFLLKGYRFISNTKEKNSPATSCLDRIFLPNQNQWFWCDFLSLWCIKYSLVSNPNGVCCFCEWIPWLHILVGWKLCTLSLTERIHPPPLYQTVLHLEHCEWKLRKWWNCFRILFYLDFDALLE